MKGSSDIQPGATWVGKKGRPRRQSSWVWGSPGLSYNGNSIPSPLNSNPSLLLLFCEYWNCYWKKKADRLGVCQFWRKHEWPGRDESSTWSSALKLTRVSRPEREMLGVRLSGTDKLARQTANVSTALDKRATADLTATGPSWGFSMSTSLHVLDCCLSVCVLIIQSYNVLIISRFFQKFNFMNRDGMVHDCLLTLSQLGWIKLYFTSNIVVRR